MHQTSKKPGRLACKSRKINGLARQQDTDWQCNG